jgi:beta-lactamase superfamily II metal-dependent hydrolase
MCYIILLEDGTFIVFDGGYKGKDPATLYETLKKLNPRKDGKVVISAWFLTHEHRDHFNAFRDFCKNYGQNGNKVQVKAAYVNFNDECMWGNMTNSANHFLSDSTTYKSMSTAVGGMEIITVRTGMEFYICNAKIEILYTEEDHFPSQLNDFNDTSTVSRVTLAGQTFLFLGDAHWVSQDNMIAMYGSELKSDIVQVSHHGWDGSRKELYQLVKPIAAFWPTNNRDFKSQSYDYSNWLRKNTKIRWHAEGQTITITPPYKYGNPFENW